MRTRKVARLAWSVLAYALAVILWGAYVRASGAGAGCGRHWPSCNGEIVPRAPRVATLIEYSHRVSSAGVLVATVVLAVVALRAYPLRHRVGVAALATVALTIAEAAIGAGLVLFGLVARDESLTRALSMSLHLMNTFLLLAAAALTAWWASGGAAPRLRGQRAVWLALAGPLVAMFAVGASGAVAALGDTLFPAPSLAAGFAQDLSAGSHLFVRLRAVHPMLAMVTAGAIVVGSGFVRAVRPSAAVRAWSRAATALATLQVCAGLLDVVTRAPTAMQIVHLFLADAVWLSLVLTAAAALAESPAAQKTGGPGVLRPSASG
ncbi:MAG TPA: COX15/CtaA family protein [Polyangiaceae bacterium]|nr:COX15/CtaA family protein [Polyangiaceae bacterium]